MQPDMDPQVAEALRLANRFYSAVGGQLHQLNTQSFTGTDEDETVEVTVNGHQWITRLHIEDGLLRLGIETVEQRVNEALQNALTAATQDAAAQGDAVAAELGDIAREMTELLAD